MKKFCKKESRYVSVLVVHVAGAEALIDMLRYDRCVPATEVESHKIMRLMTDNYGARRAEDEVARDRVIRLIRYAANDNPATKGRWESFGCRVLDERNPEAEQLTEAEALNLAKITSNW